MYLNISTRPNLDHDTRLNAGVFFILKIKDLKLPKTRQAGDPPIDLFQNRHFKAVTVPNVRELLFIPPEQMSP